MTDTIKLLASFEEIDPAANAVDALHDYQISDTDIEVVSGAPITPAMLGRHHVQSRVPKFAMGGAIAGFSFGVFLSIATPNMYSVYVGGQPLVPIPPSIVVTFEMTMLLMLLSTFIGVFLESVYPNFGKQEYIPEISDGSIVLLFDCPTEKQSAIEQSLRNVGAKNVQIAERETP